VVVGFVFVGVVDVFEVVEVDYCYIDGVCVDVCECLFEEL